MRESVSRYPLVQLRNVSAIPITNGLGEAGDPANDETWPRYIRTTDIAAVRLLDANKRVTLPPEVAGRAPVLTGDILMTSAGATVGKSYLHQTDETACFAGYLSRLRVRIDRALPEFVAYWTESPHYLYQVQSGAVKSTIENFSAAKYRAMWMPLPPLVEQRAIVDYLNQETAQIDAFIAKNEELITLLTERRAAAIARTVTGRRSGEADGQDPDWMQGLPSGWKLLPVKLLAKRVTDGAHISPETEGGEYDFVSTRDVSAGLIDFEGSLKTSPQTYSYMVRTGCQPRAGDVLYSKDGTIGETAVVRESRDFVVASSLIIITPDPSLVVSDYLRYALSSVPLLEQAKTLVRGAGLPRLSIANLATVRVPLPPLEVQRELVGWLDQVTRSIDSAIGVARRSVELARERRTALISAAVTGKLDVGVAA